VSFLSKNSATLVWIVLMLATCASTWWLSKDAFSATVGTVVIMVVAAVKVRLVMTHFMELGDAPLPWRLAFDGWVVMFTGIIVVGYLR
jgi:heme/copper-type cytochrome/quinol oxidase subunit 4